MDHTQLTGPPHSEPHSNPLPSPEDLVEAEEVDKGDVVVPCTQLSQTHPKEGEERGHTPPQPEDVSTSSEILVIANDFRAS